jgi:uncharacterized protein YjiS (DUF1127 family)
MTTIDSNDLPASAPSRSGPFTALWRAIVRNRLWHARRMTLIKLSHYDDRMLRDMGIDPQDVAEALAPLSSRSLALFLNPLGRRSDR